jgi:hypothetical protein
MKTQEYGIMDIEHPCQLSVIMVIHSDSKNSRMALRHLSAQTICDSMELIIIVTSKDVLNLAPHQLEGFYCHRIIELGTLNNCGEAKAAGVRAAKAPLVAFVEDHSYPATGCAETFVKAHGRSGVAAVGPLVLNANPSSAISWGCYLVFYGNWIKPLNRQKATHLPGNQSCYKRDLLMEYGERLSEMLEAESVLHWDLLSKGFRLHLEQEAVVYHLNFSLIVPAIFEYYFASLVFAGNRARNWNSARKILYALGSPLLPVIRLSRILKDVYRSELEPRFFWRALVPMIIILGAGAIGEMLGYAFGPGNAEEKLMDFEKIRHTYVTAEDLNEVENLAMSNKR